MDVKKVSLLLNEMEAEAGKATEKSKAKTAKKIAELNKQLQKEIGNY